MTRQFRASLAQPLPVDRRQGAFSPPPCRIIGGDCITVMQRLDEASVDFILTDPPYLVNYRDRSGRSLKGDRDGAWVGPAFAGMSRLLKPGRFCVVFYGWNTVDRFMAAWRAAGLVPVGHLVFRKDYASSARFLAHEHESAYLLAKGDCAVPATLLSDVREWVYSGNRLHPTQKPVAPLMPLIETFCPAGGVVFDPFCGSGSTLAAARAVGRRALGIELDEAYCATARRRLNC